MTAYLNPLTPYPAYADHAGMAEWNPFERPIIEDPSEAYRAEELRLPNGEPLYLTTPGKMANWLSKGPLLMYWPRDTSGTIPNLGTATLPNAELINGATASATELVAGVKSAAFDGVNDYISTGWVTRTNLMPTPNPDAALGKWIGSGNFWSAAATVTRDTVIAGPLSLPAVLKVVASGTNASEGAGQEGISVVKGETYTVSMYARGAAGGEKVAIGIGNGTLGSAQKRVTLTNEWQRFSFTYTPTESGNAPFGFANVIGEKIAQTYYGAAALVEKTGTLQFYFPQPAHLTSGEAGWSGTAYESEADIGPFARGTSRTFVMVVNRTDHVASNGLFGSGFATEGKYWLRANVTDGVELGLKSEAVTAAVWASVFSVATNTILALTMNPTTGFALYAGGVLVSEKTVSESRLAATNQGLYVGTARNFFKGNALPFAVYPRRLTAAEVASLV